MSPESPQRLKDGASGTATGAMAGIRRMEKVIPRVDDDDEVPLMPGQLLMWILHRTDRTGSAYYNPLVLGFRHTVEPGRLEAAFRELLRNHEALRTRLDFSTGDGVLRIDPLPGQVPLEMHRCETIEAAVALARRLGWTGLDLEVGPVALFHAIEVSEGPTALVVVIVAHHATLDGWSKSLLIGDLGTLLSGNGLSRKEEEPRLRDWAAWRARRLRAGELVPHEERAQKYWKERLMGDLPVMRWPLDRPRPERRSMRGAFWSGQVACGLVPALRSLASGQGATLFGVLLAAYAALLHRYGGQDEVVIGVPAACRNRPELQRLVGMLMQTFPIRVTFVENMPFAGLVQRCRRLMVEALEVQEIPIGEVISSLGLRRDPSIPPLFQTVFQLRNLPRPRVADSDWLAEEIWCPSGGSKLDLSMDLIEDGDRLQCRIEYDADLFDEETVCALAGHLDVLLRGIVEDPQCPVDALPLTTEAERRRILDDWNPRVPRWEGKQSVVSEWIARWAERDPHRIAVEDCNRMVTYGELWRWSGVAAQRLRLGCIADVCSEACVGVCVERSAALPAALLGVWRAGAAYIPLDPADPIDRQLILLADAGASAVLVTQEYLGRFSGGRISEILMPGCEDAGIEAAESGLEKFTPSSDQLACMIYTSGSTGIPKGVEIDHGNLAAYVDAFASQFQVSGADRCAVLSQVSFDALGEELWPGLSRGACVVVCPDAIRWDPVALIAWLQQCRVTLSTILTALMQLVAEEPFPDGLQLRDVVSGGDRFIRSPAQRLPFRLWNGYGPTEATIAVTAGLIETGLPRSLPPPIGRPMRHAKVYVVDVRGSLVPPGVIGELWLGGNAVGRGYRGREEETRQVFCPDPFSATSGARVYRSGDLGRWRRDGALEFIGRRDEQVQLHGYRVELGEVEVAMTSFQGVESAVVIPWETESGGKILAGFYRALKDEALDEGALASHLRRRLPAHMNPSVFCAVEHWPVTDRGKVDRHALRERIPRLLQDHRSELEPFDDGGAHPMDVRLAEIWRDVLGRSPRSSDESFFDAAGDSVQAIRIVARAGREFGCRLSLAQFLDSGTIAELRRQIMGQKQQGGRACIEY